MTWIDLEVQWQNYAYERISDGIAVTSITPGSRTHLYDSSLLSADITLCGRRVYKYMGHGLLPANCKSCKRVAISRLEQMGI